MTSNRRMFTKTALGAALVAPAIAAAHQSLADSPPAAAPAAKLTVTVTIDLERLFPAMPAFQENEAKSRQLADELEAKRKAKDDEAKKLEQDLDLFPVDSPKHKEILENFNRKSMEVGVFTEFITFKLQSEIGNSMRDQYLDLVERILPAFSKQHGYHYVLLNDNTRPIERGNVTQVNEQISARRILYADPTLDVTDALIEWIKANPK